MCPLISEENFYRYYIFTNFDAGHPFFIISAAISDL
jgi:hypothetical protein